MHIYYRIIFLIIFLIPVICSAVQWDDDEEVVPLSEVPQVVLEAAKKAVPGIVLNKAEREMESGEFLYDIEGLAAGIEYEIEISPDGTVLEIEKEDDEDSDKEGDKEDED